MKYTQLKVEKLPHPIQIFNIVNANEDDFETMMERIFAERIESKTFNILQSNYNTYMTPQNTIKWSLLLVVEIICEDTTS